VLGVHALKHVALKGAKKELEAATGVLQLNAGQIKLNKKPGNVFVHLAAITQKTVGLLGTLGVRAALLAAGPGRTDGVVAKTQALNAKGQLALGVITINSCALIFILLMEAGRIGTHGVDAVPLVA